MITWSNFLSSAHRSFGFLRDFGFKLTSETRPFVLFETEKVTVLIYYDIDGSHELDVAVRKTGEDPKRSSSVGIGMLKALDEGTKVALSSISYPETVEELEVQLEVLADTLRTHGEELLQGKLDKIDVIRRKEAEVARVLVHKTTRRF